MIRQEQKIWVEGVRTNGDGARLRSLKTATEKHQAMDMLHTESSGFLSSSSTTTRNESNRSDAIGSTVSGDSVNIQSGRDINVTGSNVAGTRDVALNAGGDVNIKAATSTYSQSSYSHTEESGLMSNGGLSISYGSREKTDQSNSNGTLQSQNRSMAVAQRRAQVAGSGLEL
jgi:filamentous hemagglutinin